jgi:hypothetical protein
MDLELKVKVGRIFGSDSPFAINLSLIDNESANACSCASILNGMQKLSRKDISMLENVIENSFRALFIGLTEKI